GVSSECGLQSHRPLGRTSLFLRGETQEHVSAISRAAGVMTGKALLLLLAGGAIVGLVGAVGIAAIRAHFAGEHALAMPARSAALIERGAYLARLGDCEACHSI